MRKKTKEALEQAAQKLLHLCNYHRHIKMLDKDFLAVLSDIMYDLAYKGDLTDNELKTLNEYLTD